MTEQEARKKAEAAASTICPGMDCTDAVWCSYYDIYMQCYRDMCGGEPDGYVATHSSGEYKHEAFFAGSNQMMTPIFLKPVTINVADKFLGWEFKPIKLLRVG